MVLTSLTNAVPVPRAVLCSFRYLAKAAGEKAFVVATLHLFMFATSVRVRPLPVVSA